MKITVCWKVLSTETSPSSRLTVSEYTLEMTILLEVQGSKYGLTNVELQWRV